MQSKRLLGLLVLSLGVPASFASPPAATPGGSEPASVSAQPRPTQQQGAGSAGQEPAPAPRGPEDRDLEELARLIADLRLRERELLGMLDEEQRRRVVSRIRDLVAAATTASEAGSAGGEDAAGGSPPSVPPGGYPESPSEVAAGATAAPQVEEGAVSDDAEPVAREPDAREADASEPDAREPGAREPGGRAVDVEPADLDPADLAICGVWAQLDTNEDGFLSGADRYWRHFALWIDDGDGRPEAEEMEDTFQLGIRRLGLDLRDTRGADDVVGVVERHRLDGRDLLRLELLDGSRSGFGYLALDVDGLVRGGAPRLRRVTESGVEEVTTGFALVGDGLEMEQPAGSGSGWAPLLCSGVR